MSRGADPHSYSRDGGRARYFAHFEPQNMYSDYAVLPTGKMPSQASCLDKYVTYVLSFLRIF